MKVYLESNFLLLGSGTSYIDPVKREKEKILPFVKTASYKTVLILRTFLPSNPSEDSMILVSTNLSPMTNSESKRYRYPVCHTLVATQHPLSRFQSPARGPALSLTRSFMAST